MPMSWNFVFDLSRYKTVGKVKSIMEDDAADMDLVETVWRTQKSVRALS